jgi:hypothetical protein
MRFNHLAEPPAKGWKLFENMFVGQVGTCVACFSTSFGALHQTYHACFRVVKFSSDHEGIDCCPPHRLFSRGKMATWNVSELI